MEAWNYYGYQIVRPTFIELSMKTKYSRDNTASQMIDIIIENSSTDFLFIWSFTDKVGNLPDIFREIFIQGENNFSSLYKKQEKTTLKKLEVLKQEAME